METFSLVSLCAQGHSTQHTCSFMLLRLGFSPWTQVNLLPQHLECWDHRPAPCAGCHTRALYGDTHRQGLALGSEVQVSDVQRVRED